MLSIFPSNNGGFSKQDCPETWSAQSLHLAKEKGEDLSRCRGVLNLAGDIEILQKVARRPLVNFCSNTNSTYRYS